MAMHPGVRGLARSQSSRLVSERRTLGRCRRKPANIPQHAESTPNLRAVREKPDNAPLACYSFELGMYW